MDSESAFFETNATPSSVGQPLNRVDGWAKVTGAAKYSAEYNHLPGLVHAVLKTSDVAKGRVTDIDTSAAQREPGVLGILTHQNLHRPALTAGTKEGREAIGPSGQMTFMPMQSDQVHYAGQPVAVVVADTLEHAQQAAAKLRVTIARKHRSPPTTTPKRRSSILPKPPLAVRRVTGARQPRPSRRRRCSSRPPTPTPPTTTTRWSRAPPSLTGKPPTASPSTIPSRG